MTPALELYQCSGRRGRLLKPRADMESRQVVDRASGGRTLQGMLKMSSASRGLCRNLCGESGRSVGRAAAVVAAAVLTLTFACQLAEAVTCQPALSKKTLLRTADPVVIAGENLGPWIGKSIDGIRLFSFREGQATSIPFQVDQRDSRGNWVWDVVYRERVADPDGGFHTRVTRAPFTCGAGTVDDQDPAGQALLDPNDLLVFMAEDLGDRAALSQLALDAPAILELEVSDQANATHGWAYLAHYEESPPPACQVRYMRYDPERKTVRSPVYTFSFCDQHVALIEDLRVKGTPIVERIKILGEITLSLPLPNRCIRFDEEDIHGYTAGYIAGPVRVVKRNIASLDIAGGLMSGPEVTCDHFYYPRHAEIPVCLSVGFPVKEVSILLTTDYRDPPFHSVFLGDAAERVRAYSSDHALHTRSVEFGAEWIALDSSDASIISLVAVPDSLQGHAHAQSCLCGARHLPIRHGTSEGVHPRTGFLISSTPECPKGEHTLYGAYLVLDHAYQPGDEDSAVRMWRNPLTVEVSTMSPVR